MIVTAMGDAITLADNNEVANFDIDGQGTLAPRDCRAGRRCGQPEPATISRSATRPATASRSRRLRSPIPMTHTRQIVRGNVTIDDVEFDNIGGNGIDIDSATATDVTLRPSRCRK